MAELLGRRAPRPIAPQGFGYHEGNWLQDGKDASLEAAVEALRRGFADCNRCEVSRQVRLVGVRIVEAPIPEFEGAPEQDRGGDAARHVEIEVEISGLPPKANRLVIYAGLQVSGPPILMGRRFGVFARIVRPVAGGSPAYDTCAYGDGSLRSFVRCMAQVRIKAARA